MNQTILFSPVGGTDPISNTNAMDGSMLHICRVYRPEKVILYMSKEVLDKQEQDDRYRYCLDRLALLQGRKMKYEIIERPDLIEVQEFDFFYQDFREIIVGITEKMDESDTLLLNISSGTPAMKSGLLVLQTLGEFDCKPIQVVTPMRRMQAHDHKDYDVEALWELNEDNQDNFENRCKEVRCPTLSAIKKEEIIKKHIAVYDYRAAISVAQTMPSGYDVKYLEFLRLADARLLLDSVEVDKILKKNDFFRLPVQSGGGRIDFEYALILDVKLKRGEYGDFIRAITPLIVDLFEMVLKKRCRIDVNDYCSTKKKKMREWNERKLRGTEVLKRLEAAYDYGSFKVGPVYSDHLKILIEAYSKESHLKRLVGDLREVEKKVRNLAAHEVVSIKNETIKELTGLTGNQIMDRIKDIFAYTGISVKQEHWDSYDEMNRKILEMMDRK